MPLTQQELDSFHRFATQKLNNGGAGLSLEECLDLWRLRQGRDESVAAIRQGIADADTGRTRSLADVEAALCDEFGFARRRA